MSRLAAVLALLSVAVPLAAESQRGATVARVGLLGFRDSPHCKPSARACASWATSDPPDTVVE